MTPHVAYVSLSLNFNYNIAYLYIRWISNGPGSRGRIGWLSIGSSPSLVSSIVLVGGDIASSGGNVEATHPTAQGMDTSLIGPLHTQRGGH